jgi:DMSO/TMAO reductase YedYZ molybdopterin-dependent catalytic subunit
MHRLIMMMAVLCGVLPGVAGAQPSGDADEVLLRVTGEVVSTPLVLTRAAFRTLPHDSVQVQFHESPPQWYHGVRLQELLRRAGVPTGDQVRGEAMSLVVLCVAHDGYRVVFGLTDLDPDFTDRVALVADTVDGKPLPDAEGPLRLVMLGEKRGARMPRQLTEIRVLRVQP